MSEISPSEQSRDEQLPLTNLEQLTQQYENLKRLHVNLLQAQAASIREQMSANTPILDEATRSMMQYDIDITETELYRLADLIDREMFKGEPFRKSFLRRLHAKRSSRTIETS